MAGNQKIMPAESTDHGCHYIELTHHSPQFQAAPSRGYANTYAATASGLFRFGSDMTAWPGVIGAEASWPADQRPHPDYFGRHPSIRPFGARSKRAFSIRPPHFAS